MVILRSRFSLNACRAKLQNNDVIKRLFKSELKLPFKQIHFNILKYLYLYAHFRYPSISIRNQCVKLTEDQHLLNYRFLIQMTWNIFGNVLYLTSLLASPFSRKSLEKYKIFKQLRRCHLFVEFHNFCANIIYFK